MKMQFVISSGLLVFCSPLAIAEQSVSAEPDLDFARDARPFLDTYCAKCHNSEKIKGGVNLDIFKDEVSLYKHRTRVEEVIEQLTHNDMPPEDAKQPDEESRTKLVDWLTWKMENVDYARFSNPGYMPSHRLTRRQYRNTIRDLIGVGMEVADDLPTDEATHGFDQIGDVQDVSAVHLEKYLAAANYILDRVFVPAEQTSSSFAASSSSMSTAVRILAANALAWPCASFPANGNMSTASDLYLPRASTPPAIKAHSTKSPSGPHWA